MPTEAKKLLKDYNTVLVTDESHEMDHKNSVGTFSDESTHNDLDATNNHESEGEDRIDDEGSENLAG